MKSLGVIKIVMFIVVILYVTLGELSAYTNNQIADIALEHNNQAGFTCKEFVQHVINSHLAGNLGSGYRDSYLNEGEGLEVKESEAIRGDIIQISNNQNPSDESHVHTAIVLENFGNGNFKVVHSNWCTPYCYKVSVTNSYNFSSWASASVGYSAHYYRLGIISPTNFTFLSGSSEGMKPNWCMKENPLPAKLDGTKYDEWRVQVINLTDPGVDSPEYPRGTAIGDTLIEFSAKVANGRDSTIEGKVYVRDYSGQTGEWDHKVPLVFVRGGSDYQIFRADLSAAKKESGVINIAGDLRQFSIQLTNGGSLDELWTFDWIRVMSKSVLWDFTDKTLGWTIKQYAKQADFFASDWWRIEPTGKQPQIVSPYLYDITSNFIKVGIRYSVQNGGKETARVYFDTGNGFSASCYSGKTIAHNGSGQSAIFDIPPCAAGKIQRIMFDLFDNADYANKLISINKISFLKGDSTDDADFKIAAFKETEVSPPPINLISPSHPIDLRIGE